ncbi:MAG: PAS domain-containing protein [Bryobacteraceae bacterium]
MFDAMPLPAFVVDRDFNIVDFNLAGAKLLDRVPFAVLRLRGGDRLECVHTAESAGEGSSEPCRDCIVKNFVREVFSQSEARRSTGRLRLTRGETAADMDFLITVAPIPDEAEPLALLILDDAAQLAALLPERDRGTTASSSPDSKVPAKEPDHKKGNS